MEDGKQHLRQSVALQAAEELRADAVTHGEEKHDEEDRFDVRRDGDLHLPDQHTRQEHTGDRAETEVAELEIAQPVVALARRHEDIVFSVAVGNECTVDWTDHFVPVSQMVEYARRVKAAVAQPVTFCENYVPWQDKLRPLVAELDFISVHTYPVWEYKHIHEALDYTKDNVAGVARLYPDKPVVITEAGWCTASNGRGMHAEHAVQELQAVYYQDLMDWTRAEGLLCFVFEAFDEPWKGSPDPLEPEKHWGLFTVDRRPKLVMQALYPDLAPQAADA